MDILTFFETNITLDVLMGLGGQVAAVILVVGFLKLMFRLSARGAVLASWVAAMAILAVVYANQGLVTLDGGWVALATVALLWALNSMLVTWLAQKGYEQILEPLKHRLIGPPDEPQGPTAPYLFRRIQHRL